MTEPVAAMAGSDKGPSPSRLQTGTLAEASSRTAMILVVDDDPEVREIVAEFLLDAGYSVAQAEGGPQALQLLDRGIRPDLVITDIRMPEMSGIELADRMSRTYPELKIILISGFFVSQKIERRVLRKPFRMKELAEAVDSELAWN